MKMRMSTIFIGNSYLASELPQEDLIPALLRSRGIDMATRTVYAPGQTLSGHIENNRGRVSPMQRDDIEEGRRAGWFTDDKCDWFYATYRSLEGRLDTSIGQEALDSAFVLLGSKETRYPERFDPFSYGKQLASMLRTRHPDIRIILVMPWTDPDEPEYLPRFRWVTETLARDIGADIAPVGAAFAEARERWPDLSLHRSAADPHQNKTSCFLIAYTCIAALARGTVDDLAASFEPAQGPPVQIDEDIAAGFRQIAAPLARQERERLAAWTPEMQAEPDIAPPESAAGAAAADRRLLVLGHAAAGAGGRVWTALADRVRTREGRTLAVEDLTDDAATLQSVLANERGEMTPRQKAILDEVTRLQTRMGEAVVDMDELDGMGDYPIDMIRDHLARRRGKLARALSSDVPWDAVLIIPFRGAWAPDAHDFFAAGRSLVALIREARPETRILLFHPWPPRDADPATGEIIAENCRTLARACGLEEVPVGAAWSRETARGADLYASLHEPAPGAVPLIADLLHEHLPEGET